MSKLKWTKEEIFWLINNYPKFGRKYCANYLNNKTHEAVIGKAKFLKLKIIKYIPKEGCKVCSKCKIEKIVTEFSLRTNSKNGYRSECKQCAHHKTKYDYNLNIELSRKKQKIREQKYIENNYQKYRNRKNKYKKYRYDNDTSYKLLQVIRARILAAIKASSGKKIRKSSELLGCSIQEVKKYIELKFKTPMSWDNHGKIWDIDHIIPCASFDLSDPEQQRKCFHYTNLQPLWKTTEIAQQHGDMKSIGNYNKLNKILPQNIIGSNVAA